MIILKRCQPHEPVLLHKLRRDGARSLEFEGRQIAGVEVDAWHGRAVARLAIYLTRGRRYVSEFRRNLVADCRAENVPVGLRVTNRAMVFDRLDDAMGYFWPGRPADELRAQLDMLDPEFVE